MSAATAAANGARGTIGAALKKDAMMVRNLQLLGFDPTAATSGSRTSRSDASTTLHPNMLDRPNEKLLFAILHFLVLEIKPQIEHELRFCWPIVTPHDKSNFKRLVQTVLSDLEKQGAMPVGSSHASRLNAGYGPRIVDLLWRLTTYAMKTVLHRGHTTYSECVPSSRSGGDTAERVELLKARIAMKNRQLQEQFLSRSLVQDQWVAFATTITSKIAETDRTLQQVYQAQSELDASVDRAMFSQVADAQRTTQSTNTNTSWRVTQEILTSAGFQSSQTVLDTALQHHGDQPVLDGRQLRPQRSFSDRAGAVNLSDIVRNADALIQLTRARLSQQESLLQLTSQDQNRMDTISRESNAYVATLVSALQQLREQLIEVKRSNELATRDLCIEMAANNLHDGQLSLSLCPPTPADKMLQESDLLQSLKKCSMNDLSEMAAQSVRKTNKRKSLEIPMLEDVSRDDVASAKPESAEENSVFRRLHYDLADDGDDHPMEH